MRCVCVRRTAILDIISQCTADLCSGDPLEAAEKFLSGVSDGFSVRLLIEPAASRLAIPLKEVFDEDMARGRAVLP
jgi:hypothetical protein